MVVQIILTQYQRQMLSGGSPRYVIGIPDLRQYTAMLQTSGEAITKKLQAQVEQSQVQQAHAQAQAQAHARAQAQVNAQQQAQSVASQQQAAFGSRSPAAMQGHPSAPSPRPTSMQPPHGQHISQMHSPAAPTPQPTQPSPRPSATPVLTPALAKKKPLPVSDAVASSSTPPASVHTPAANAPTPNVSSPQTPKSPRQKPKPKPAQKRKPSVKGPPPAAVSTPAPAQTPADQSSPAASASTPETSTKRRREEDISPFAPTVSDAPSPKKLKTEWDGPVSDEVTKKKEEIESIKTDEDANKFFETMMQAMTASGPMAAEISEQIDQILQGCGASASDNLGLLADPLMPPSPLLNNNNSGLGDGLNEFFDFSLYGAYEEESPSKVNTPDLVHPTSQNPSPGSTSETEVLQNGPDVAKIVDPKTEDGTDDPLRLGIWKEIDGGQGAFHMPSDGWKFDGPMPTHEQPWSLLP